MRIDDIENLVDLVAEADVSEVIVESGGRRVTVRRFESACAPPAAPAAPAVATPEPPDGLAATAEPSEASPPRYVVTAPMVGVFHPADPPIRAGSRVRPGHVVGAIESMKLMNDVRAEAGGVVTEVLVEDGMPVDYGHPLFAMETD